MSLLVTGAQLPDGSRADLYVDGSGRFADSTDATAGVRRIDADGLVALPGLVDLHAHLREPGFEDAETLASGTAAAARGGYTAVFAMADTSPVTDTAEAAQHVRNLAVGASALVTPVGAVTRQRAGTELAELGLMARVAGVRFFSDACRCISDAGVLRRAMEYGTAFDAVVAQHAQDPHLAGASACCHESEISGRLGLPGWPAVAESVIVARDVQIAGLTGARLHVCHVSTAESVEVIRWAKRRGIRVTAEVAPHHLYFTTREVESYDPTFKVNPPLRTSEHVAALVDALVDGTIDAVATDHDPYEAQDADHAFSDARGGMLGLEQALAVVTEVALNRMGWSGIADRMSQAPARIGGVDTVQGRPLAVGEPATFVLVDPAARAVVDRDRSASRSRNNPYHGRDLPEPVVCTVWNGRVTFDK